jgi:hypothetical protein
MLERDPSQRLRYMGSVGRRQRTLDRYGGRQIPLDVTLPAGFGQPMVAATVAGLARSAETAPEEGP